MAYKHRRWTKREDEQLRRLYDKRSLKELGILFNRHYNKVCRRAMKLGIKKNKKKIGRRISETQREQFKLGIRSNKGEKNPNWKGGWELGMNKIKYNSIHEWLRKKYGRADRCENPNCLKISNNYTYAKLDGKSYEKKRENFIMLCKSCHTIYDKKHKAKSEIIGGLVGDGDSKKGVG